MKTSFLSFIMLTFFVVTSAVAIEPQWVIDLHEAHTNAGMPYRLLRPLNFDPGRLYPVIVSLHSAPGVADDNIRNIRQWNTQLSDPQLRADYPAYVVVPQVLNAEGKWDQTHLQRVQDIISNELVNVDMGRIYILGQSLGGYGTWKFINWTGPGYFAAAAPVSGSGQPSDPTEIKNIPIWAFHGTDDTVIKYSLDQIFFNLMVGVGNEKLTAFVGVGHSTDDKFIYYAGDPGADHGVTYFSDATNMVKVCDPEPVFMKWLFSKRLPGWYPLTVNSGNGSGSYTNGRQVAISAKAVSGMTFVQWTGDTQVVNNVTYTNALVTMSTNAVTLTATYTNLPGWYLLTVNNGTGSGAYSNEMQVLISASNAPAGQTFDRWTGDTQFVGSVTSATATVTMPGQDLSLTATYKNVHVLTVNNGTGSGTYDGGQQVQISANPGRTFAAWIGDTQYVSSATASPATVTMPASGTNGVILTATYTDVILTVIGGTGSGSYTNGQTVTISRSDVRAGVSLRAWIGTGAPYVTSSNTVVMPPQDITLTATYNYTLTVNSGTGSGIYTNGQSVPILASNAPSGKTFDRWTGDTQYVDEVILQDTMVNMSTNPVTLTATYVDYVSATIAVVDSTGGETSSTNLIISKVFPTTGGNMLVVNLSYKGVNSTYPASPGPTNLYWVTGSGAVTQTMTEAVQAGNTAAKAFGSSIYYLQNPVADSGGTISGSLPAGYAAQIISAFTLSGVDTTALPIIATNINNTTSSSSITTTVAGVSAGGFAALCSGSAATNSGTGFSASASGGTPVNWLTSSFLGGYWYQGYISNLVTTTTNFICAQGSAARLHIVAAVFSPGNLATIIPALQAPTAAAITATTATLGATVIPNGGSTIDDYGIVYAATAVNSAPEAGGPGAIKLQKGTNQTMGAFTVNATGLTPGAQYSYAGYAHNSAGYGYSSYGTFTVPYMLTASAGLGGTVSPANASVPAGGSTNFVITASNYYRIATLTTNGTAVTGMTFDNNSTTTNFTWSNVQTSGVLAVIFTAQVVTNAANTPHEWLAGYGLTNYEADAVFDQDGDGLTAWQEYITGTDPTNTTSGLMAAQNNRNVITWSPVPGRVYSVYWATNLMNGFQPLETNILYPQGSCTNATPDPRINLYQIKVRMQ